MIGETLGIWFYSKMELSEMLPLFSKIFHSNDMDREFESKWEWLCGYSEDQHAHINIRREHNKPNGCYDKPIVLEAIFKKPSTDTFDELETIAEALCKIFSETVHVGYIHYDGAYRFEELSSFSKMGRDEIPPDLFGDG